MGFSYIVSNFQFQSEGAKECGELGGSNISGGWSVSSRECSSEGRGRTYEFILQVGQLVSCKFHARFESFFFLFGQPAHDDIDSPPLLLHSSAKASGGIGGVVLSLLRAAKWACIVGEG